MLLQLEPFAWLALVAPLTVLFGGTLLAMVLINLLLNYRGSHYTTIGTCLLGIAVFILLELVMGLFIVEFNIVILVFVLPFLLREAISPSGGGQTFAWPQLIQVTENQGYVVEDVLCFQYGNGYAALAALVVTAVTFPSEETQEDEEVVDWLRPLWEEGRCSGVTYTYEVVVEDRVAVHIYAVVEGKDWVQVLGEARRARLVAETSLGREGRVSLEVLEGEALCKVYQSLDFGEIKGAVSSIDAAPELKFLGVVSLQGWLPADVEDLVRQMLAHKIRGTLLMPFMARPLPHLKRLKEHPLLQVDEEHQVRLPRRVEDHLLRDTYQQLEFIQLCEETGCFHTGTTLIIQGASLDKVEAKLRLLDGVLAAFCGTDSVKVMPLKRWRRRWGEFLLRRALFKGQSVSGDQIGRLLQIRNPLPGMPCQVLAPDFSLPPIEDYTPSTLGLGWGLWRENRVQPVILSQRALVLHMVVLGESGFGKTRFVAHLLKEVATSESPPHFLLFDLKGEYSRLVSADCEVVVPGGDVAPLRVSLFDPQGEDPTSYGLRLLGIFQDNLVQTFGERISPLGTRLLREALAKTIRAGPRGWNFSRLFREIDSAASRLRKTVREVGQSAEALKNRLQRFSTGVMGEVLTGPATLDVDQLLKRNLVVDLSVMLQRGCTRADLRLLLNLLLHRVLRQALQRGISVEDRTENIVVVEEANILAKGGGVGGETGLEEIVLLARSAGVGLVLVAQRPTIPEDVLANAGTRVVFRSPWDARLLGRYLNLTEEQENYLKVLPRREALVMVPHSSQAIRLQTPRVEVRIKRCSDGADVSADRTATEENPATRRAHTIAQQLSEETFIALHKLIETNGSETSPSDVVEQELVQRRLAQPKGEGLKVTRLGHQVFLAYIKQAVGGVPEQTNSRQTVCGSEQRR